MARRSRRASSVDELKANIATNKAKQGQSKPVQAKTKPKALKMGGDNNNSLRSNNGLFQKESKGSKPTKTEKQRQMLGLSPTEDQIQIAVMHWAKLQTWKKGKISDYLHHSPNGGKRGKIEASRFKAMGVKAGFPDLFLPIARCPFNGLFIELKSANGRVSVAQAAYHPLLIDEGYRVEVAYTAEGAINLMKNYLGLAI